MLSDDSQRVFSASKSAATPIAFDLAHRYLHAAEFQITRIWDRLACSWECGALPELGPGTSTPTWTAFQRDPDWEKARASSEENGPLVRRSHRKVLRPTPYSAAAAQ